MRVIVADHPLVAHKLTHLRDERTDSPTFRQLTEELMTLLAYEATRTVRVEHVGIETPMTVTTGTILAKPVPIVIPILRAGIGLLEGMLRLVPTAEVGFLGMKRDEETLEIENYASRLPRDLTGRQVFVLDPMLATGGSLTATLHAVVDRNPDDITAVTLISAPEGIERVRREMAGVRPPITLVTGAVDERLDEFGFIVPGLGDAGDRLYGTTD